MNISVVAVGTRGDVEPHMALAVRLAARGHRVTLAAPLDFAEQSRARGLNFHPIDVSFRDLFGSSAGAALLASGNKSFGFLRQLQRVAVPIAEQVVSDLRVACRGADAVCYSPLAVPACYIAREMGIPAIPTSLQPLGRTRFTPSPLYSLRLRLPGRLNMLTHLVMEQLFWQLCRPLIRPYFRAALPGWGHFNELYRSGRPMLFAYSPSLVPPPADFGPSMHVTGFWRLPAESGWTPPTALADFLSAGPPPICIGFGSMNTGRVAAMLRTALRAITDSGRRAIVLTGWWEDSVGPELRSDEVHVTDAVPHEWLFPKVAAVVHHGGAGTTASALRAGVPSVVLPFFFDQWFWGQCLHRQMLGPEPISARQLSAGSLQRALEAVTALGPSTWIRQRLERLSRRLRSEDGVGNAVDVIEEAWTGRRPTGTRVAAG